MLAGSVLNFTLPCEASSGLYLVLTADLIVAGASEAYLGAAGIVREGIIGRHVSEAFAGTPDDVDAAGAINLSTSLDRVLRTGKPDVMPVQKYDLRGADGRFEERYWSFRNFPVLDGAGKLLWIIHQAEDVTDKVRLGSGEEAVWAGSRDQTDLIDQLRQATADGRRLATIVEGSRDAIIGKTLDGIVTSWNRGAESLFGYSATEMMGNPIARLIPPDRLVEEEMILDRVRRGEPVEHYETVRRHKDGREVEVSLSVSPIRDEQGLVVGASKIARDITEQNAARDRLEELQAELLHVSRLNDMGQLASAFAHELNQPLSAIGNYLHATSRLIDAGDLARAADGCARASLQVARLGDIIRRLRDFVKKQEGHRAVEDLATVVEEACALALIGSRTDGVAVAYDLAPEARNALINRVEIQQIVVNLIRNAVEATAGSDRREITCATRRLADGMIEISVADTGPGIAPEVRARLFQPFTSTKPTGMGVGLSLCRTIGQAHGGEIWAEDNPSGGATFRFTAPSGEFEADGSSDDGPV